ncbi:hypothetical protein F511_40470 [Dorcoceras hygrometricum]|uniref:Uncharacterized protein n=1 Tax=Dorcoceras hygrometricum TaxID=472368 RepID=A0A2Z7BUD5_9LAMI|nr:hypothetical protein F511_40470 [Dorcoceras hygrometricum]
MSDTKKEEEEVMFRGKILTSAAPPGNGIRIRHCRQQKDERHKREEEDDERTLERSKDKSKEKFKDLSKDMRMKIKSDKRPSRRNDRKVLVAEKAPSARQIQRRDSDSESSSSSSSSSDSEQEEVHCLMADQMDDDEEVKAENISLQNSSTESSSVELEDVDSLKTELSRLTTENEMLKDETSELQAEIETLNQVVSAWNRSSRSLHKLHESQKLASDRNGLGFNSNNSSDGETSTQSQPVYDKFNKMEFVKADVIYDCCESIRYDDQKSSQSSHEEKEKMASAIKGLRVPSPAG